MEDVQSKVKGNTEGLQKSLEDLNRQLEQQVEEFRRTVEPMGEMFNKALVQQLEQFRQQLGPNSGEVESHLSFLEKSLREKVNSFMSTLEKRGAQTSLKPSPSRSRPRSRLRSRLRSRCSPNLWRAELSLVPSAHHSSRHLSCPTTCLSLCPQALLVPA